VLEHLDRTWRGWRIDLDNRQGVEPLAGLLQGAAVHLDSVKSLDPPCGCVKPVDDGLAFEVAPGQRYRLAVLAASAAPLVVRHRDPQAGAVTVMPAAAPITLLAGPAGWYRESPRDTREEPRVVLEWREPVFGPPTGGPDEELRRQLRALDYLGA
jgi:hypothetical protein